ncbi:MAG: tetratricopeptide repeat protein [Candidatus Krumholzibacteriaceae bacterium]|jgi:tetratricopeptide (TPR) repeat protein
MKFPAAVCILAVVLAGCLFSPAAAQEGQLAPVPSTAHQDSLLQLGMYFHDKGRYDEAIGVYETILQENPANVIALFEMSYSCMAKGDNERALSCAQRGLKYRADALSLSLLYMNEGNALDNLGRPDEGIAAYRKGLTYGQKRYLFLYNLGLAFYRKSEMDSARAYFQGALIDNPRHASSNLALANVYKAKQKRAPEVLALARFLMLEPDSRRSPSALQGLRSALQSGISSSGGEPGQVTLSFAQNSDAVDGDVSLLDMTLTMAGAANMTDSEKKTDVQSVAKIFDGLFGMMREHRQKENPGGFCWDYYAPYFGALDQNGHTEAFAYHIFRSAGDTAVTAWLKLNDDSIRKLVQWDSEYAWKK